MMLERITFIERLSEDVIKERMSKPLVNRLVRLIR